MVCLIIDTRNMGYRIFFLNKIKMDNIETLNADLTETRRQLALVNSQLETVGVSEAERIALGQRQVALLTEKARLEDRIISLSTPEGILFPLSLHLNLS